MPNINRLLVGQRINRLLGYFTNAWKRSVLIRPLVEKRVNAILVHAVVLWTVQHILIGTLIVSTKRYRLGVRSAVSNFPKFDHLL